MKSLKSSSHQWAAAFGISLLVLVSLVVIIASRSSIGDIRNRAGGINCQEDTVKHTCGNPQCAWDSDVGPYGSCVPDLTVTPTPYLPDSFREICKTNANALYSYPDSSCSWNSATPCLPGAKATRVVTCSGKQFLDKEGTCSTPEKEEQCASYHNTVVNTQDRCPVGVGCWVKSSSYCVVVGETNSGYVCQANGTFVKAGGADESYRTPERTRPECEGQGNCWFGSYCLKSGRVGQESGEGSGHRSYCCNNGRLESSQGTNGDSCAAPSGANVSNTTAAVPSVSPTTPPIPSAVCDYLRSIGYDLCRQ